MMVICMLLIKNKNILPVIVAVLLSTAVLMLSCGAGGGDSGPTPHTGSGRGSVALFITDNISFYKQFVSTITGVRLVNSGTGGICTVLEIPVTFDISNLTNMAQYTSVAQCPKGNYNRIDVNFRGAVHLMDQLGATSACAYTSYTNESGDRLPLTCNSATGICTLSIQGGARGVPFLVQEDFYNDLGIDFDLKQFTVTDFGNPAACAVNMKVFTVNAADMNSSGRSHGATGSMQGLDTAKGIFTLLAGGVTLTVDYSGINPALQPNIDTLLKKAWTEGLSVNVLTGSIDLQTRTIAANRIYVKVAGSVSEVKDNPQWTFDLAYGSPDPIAGSHKPPADVQGAFLDDAWVNAKFDGYDDKKARYLAASIEVLPAGTVLDD
jgi:hypothetical protein